MSDESIPELSPEERAAQKKEAKRLYDIQYRLEHQQEKRDQDLAYRTRDPALLAERQRATSLRYRAKNHKRLLAKEREKRVVIKAKFVLLPPEEQERIRERQRAANRRSYAKHRAKRIAATDRWHRKNPEKTKIYQQRHDRAHPEKVCARAEVRRARKAAAPINDFTAAQWRALCKAVGYRCAYCGQKFPFRKLTQDHITPLAKGGSHTLSNIIPACGSCNSRKHVRDVPKPVQPFLLLDEGAAD